MVMDKHKALINIVARAIADQNGDQWEFVPEDKPDWIDNRGMSQGRSRDINEPFRCDYEEMATAALSAVYEALEEPSDPMHDAAAELGVYKNARRVWQDMLSASALSVSPLQGEE